MYVGPIMGMLLAYQALGPYDEAYRKLIREDLFTFAWELHRLRTINVIFDINGAEGPADADRCALHGARGRRPGRGRHLEGHRGSRATSATGTSGAGRSSFPTRRWSSHQVPGWEWVPDIPRTSSAMMVGAFIRAALSVTEGHEEFEPERSLLEDFYYENDDEWGNAYTWAESAASYSFDHDGCGQAYFGLNIAMQPLYLWSMLEDEPAPAQHDPARGAGRRGVGRDPNRTRT